MTMARFAVGDYVKLVGPLSEHYGEATATVVNVYLHPDLSHLNQYRVRMSGGDDVFYEFQLIRSAAGPVSIPNRDLAESTIPKINHAAGEVKKGAS
jgi:hypothetical protein